MKRWLRRELQDRLHLDVVRHPPTSRQTFPGHTRHVLASLGIDCVLDVGANVGQYGSLLRGLGYRGSIVSFEPVRATYEELLERAARDDSWQTMPVALGADDGTVEINVTASSVLASLRRPRSDTPEWVASQLALAEPEDVDVVRLDSIFDQVTAGASNVFLKLDTQGWDLEVLSGATECLDRIVAVQTEVSVVPLYEGMPTWLESLQRLERLGYLPTWMAPVVFDGPVRPLELDCLFVRAGSTP